MGRYALPGETRTNGWERWNSEGAGGGNFAGCALCQGSLMIDLTPMKGITVDAAARRAGRGDEGARAGRNMAAQQRSTLPPTAYQ